MKNLKTLCLILIGLCYSMVRAQTQEAEEKQHHFATFEIQDARENGNDISEEVLKEKATLVLYRSTATDSILFSNFWKKSDSQSYGSIYSIIKSDNPDKEEDDKSEVYTFYWSYYNTYDQKSGTAKVKILVVYKPQGTYFEITILPENLDELVYKGRMEGDLAILEWNSDK